MATTAKGLRYPTSADTVDIAGDIQNLATDIDTVHAAQTYSLTTKGSLPTRSASAYAPLAGVTQPAGLRALDSASNGLEWGSYPAAGWSLAGSTTIANDQAIIFVRDIPLGFKELMAVWTGYTPNSVVDIAVRTNPYKVDIVTTASSSSSRWTYTTATPHGLSVGDGAYIVSARANSSFFCGSVEAVHSTTKFTVGTASEQTAGIQAAVAGDYVMNPGTQHPNSGSTNQLYSTASSGSVTWTTQNPSTAEMLEVLPNSTWTTGIYIHLIDPSNTTVNRKAIVRGTSTHPNNSTQGTGLQFLNIASTESINGICLSVTNANYFNVGATLTVWGLK